MNRRSFLTTIPAIATIATLAPRIALAGAPILYCDGVHDDTDALQALIDGKPVRNLDGRRVQSLHGGTYLLRKTLWIRNNGLTATNSTFVGAGFGWKLPTGW